MIRGTAESEGLGRKSSIFKDLERKYEKAYGVSVKLKEAQ